MHISKCILRNKDRANGRPLPGTIEVDYCKPQFPLNTAFVVAGQALIHMLKSSLHLKTKR